MQKIINLYLLLLCIAGGQTIHAMDDDPEKKHVLIGKKEMDARMDAAIDTATNEEILQKATEIAIAVGMPDRGKIIAESICHAKQQSEYGKHEPVFVDSHARNQQASWGQTMPYYIKPLPYDCSIVVQKVVKTGNTHTPIDLPESHTMHAHTCSLKDGQSIVMIAIREYTRKKDGKLNADQLISCRMSFENLTKTQYSFDIRAGDAWQHIEKIIKAHLE